MPRERPQALSPGAPIPDTTDAVSNPASGRTGLISRPDSSRRRALAAFAGAALIAMVAVVGVAVVVSQRAGTEEAIRDARSKTQLLAHTVVEPNLAKGLVAGEPAAIALLDDMIHSRDLGPDVARIKIWAADGTIVYSDEPRLVGSRYPLGEEEQQVLAEGGLEAEVSDLTKPENRFEQSVGQMLEVYLPIRSPEGTPLLFETYYSYDSVTDSARRIWTLFVPIVVGGLLLFGILLAPLAWRLASRVQRDQQVKAELLESAIASSDAERQRIASDLHDGVVQDLSGVALTLAGVGAQLPPGSDEAGAVQNAGHHTRGAIRALRSLLVEIYPPNLKQAGIENALLGLAASLEARGITTTVEVDLAVPLTDSAEALIFRVAQEALRNVIRHAAAGVVTVRLTAADDLAELTITDDGVGLPAALVDRAPSGHFGLRLMTDLATKAGGTVWVGPGPGSGTTIRLEVPLT